MATQVNSADTALTFDISSLATSTTFLAGYASAEINLANAVELILSCDGVTGGATIPAVGQSINIYFCGSDVSLATTPVGGINGTTGAKTLTHAQVLNSLVQVGSAVVTIATASLVYYFQPIKITGPLPKFGQFYLAHSHAGALAAAQAGLFSYYTTTYA